MLLRTDDDELGLGSGQGHVQSPRILDEVLIAALNEEDDDVLVDALTLVDGQHCAVVVEDHLRLFEQVDDLVD